MKMATWFLVSMAMMSGLNAFASLYRIWRPMRYAENKAKFAAKALAEAVAEGRTRPTLLMGITLTVLSFAMSAITIVATYVVLDAVP